MQFWNASQKLQMYWIFSVWAPWRRVLKRFVARLRPENDTSPPQCNALRDTISTNWSELRADGEARARGQNKRFQFRETVLMMKCVCGERTRAASGRSPFEIVTLGTLRQRRQLSSLAFYHLPTLIPVDGRARFSYEIGD